MCQGGDSLLCLGRPGDALRGSGGNDLTKSLIDPNHFNGPLICIVSHVNEWKFKGG